jgi:dTDP-glucose 4,6-dehydratase
MRILVTGGAGFIGSAFVRYVLVNEPAVHVVTLDALTYAGNLENLAPIADNPRHTFVHGNICDAELVSSVFADARPDVVVHFAAESHVDRSILAPQRTVETNVRGTAILLDAARESKVARFLHVSTDEVYGDIPEPLEADETFPVRPSSPYAASKAASDLLALAYARTYRLPVIVTRASNNYGPYQFPEKLIPLMISNALERKPLPIYGDGLQVRDWLFVDDHCRALWAILQRGSDGEVYNVGGNCHLTNLDVVARLLRIVAAPETLLTFVDDRPGHDRRYALRSEKLLRDTGFFVQTTFDAGLANTVRWYQENAPWIRRIKSGEYREFYERNYSWRKDHVLTSGDLPAVGTPS